MRNRWNDQEAAGIDSLLRMRVYTSRLLGQEEDLVLHGGGNTSVKLKEKNIFGEEEEILYVKGSGWDLGSIEEAGFAPVRLQALQKMAALPGMTDLEMVKQQRMAMTNPSAPNPSVEAILHAIIPFQFVDHTHADAVVTISNTHGGKERLQSLYGSNVLILPYVMPGFVLAKQVYEIAETLNWEKTEAIILLQHGVFTFAHDAKSSYEKMIEIVSRAENYLSEVSAAPPVTDHQSEEADLLQIARFRKKISSLRGQPVLLQTDCSTEAVRFSMAANVADITMRGPLTPDHIIRTKQKPMVGDEDLESALNDYAVQYQEYFLRNTNGSLQCLDKAPRWAIWRRRAILSMDNSISSVHAIQDIYRHTISAISKAEAMGGWTALPEKDLFDVEYWSLEQEKLKKSGAVKPMQGKVAFVTGAAGGIGKACVEKLLAEGAVVAALDVNPLIKNIFSSKNVLPLLADVTDRKQLNDGVQQAVKNFGGIDMLVSNAGLFPASAFIAHLPHEDWNNSLSVNLSSHYQLLQCCLPYLECGIEPAIVIIGSKNVAAPGPGAGAYSVAKAGLNQLGRVAALELGAKGVRVNMLHPNAVFDTGIWSKETLENRASHYGLTVEEYKTSNILKTEVTSSDVAALAITMLGSVFSKTTGAQVPVDGGNDRVI